METLVAPTFNFVLLVVGLYLALKGPTRLFVRGRHERLKKDIDEVQQALQKAKREFEEFGSKLGSVNQEVETLRKQAEAEINDTKRRVAAESQAMAAKIVEDARATAAALAEDLRTTISAEIGRLVLDKTEKLIRERLTHEDKSRIRQEFSKQVEGGQL